MGIKQDFECSNWNLCKHTKSQVLLVSTKKNYGTSNIKYKAIFQICLPFLLPCGLLGYMEVRKYRPANCNTTRDLQIISGVVSASATMYPLTFNHTSLPLSFTAWLIHNNKFLYEDLQATNTPSGKKFVVPFLSDEMSVPPVIWTVHYKLHSASQWIPTRKLLQF